MAAHEATHTELAKPSNRKLAAHTHTLAQFALYHRNESLIIPLKEKEQQQHRDEHVKCLKT